jgi:hypothetical protein
VPEVGLELHSGPCNHWEVRKTKAIRASPTNVRPSPKRKSVDIVHTFFLLRFQLPRGHHRGFPLVTKHALSAKGIPVGLHPPIALALAKAVERIPEVGALPGSLLYEPKWDGYIHFTLPISGPSIPLPIKLMCSRPRGPGLWCRRCCSGGFLGILVRHGWVRRAGRI